MDFFEHQDLARRRSGRLVLLFALAVVFIIAAVYGVFAPFIRVSPPMEGAAWISAGVWKYWDPQLFLLTSAGTLLLVLGGTLYKISLLRGGGGEAVADMFKGHYLSLESATAKERMLVHIVEEMAIASGIGIPKVYVIEGAGINAFAAGYSANSAVIGVTQGCLDKLSRQELQGVVAHEFSHILNGDMKGNLMLVGLLHGILLLSITGHILLRSVRGGGRSGRGGGQAAMLFLAVGVGLVLIGYLGVFFGKLIKAAVSRQREYLADASAVQFTRDPDGLRGALVKIAGDPLGAQVDNPRSEEISHLFFGDACGSKGGFLRRASGAFGLLDTHPPIADRIKRLGDEAGWKREEATRGGRNGGGGRIGGATLTGTLSESKTLPVGSVAPSGIRMAGGWMEGLDPLLAGCARNPSDAWAVILSILLARLPVSSRTAGEGITGRTPDRIWMKAQDLFSAAEKLSPDEILPLTDLALSSLRRLPASELRAAEEGLAAFSGICGGESLFGYMVTSFLRARIMDAEGKRVEDRGDNLGESIMEVLSVLARQGHPESEEEAGEAYSQAIGQFCGSSWAAGVRTDYRGLAEAGMPGSTAGLGSFDKALFSLRGADPFLKKALLDACHLCIFSDNAINSNEHALFRAIAGVLDCPVPPDLRPRGK